MMTTLLWVAGAAVAGLSTYIITAIVIRILKLRAHELTDALNEYEKKLATVLRDPATPASVIQFLEMFDRHVGRRETAMRIAKDIFKKGPRWLSGSDEKPQVLKDADGLKDHRPDLYDDFATVIANGFMATMLRWFFPARAFALIFIDPRRDPFTPARAVACANDDDFHNQHHGPIAATA